MIFKKFKLGISEAGYYFFDRFILAIGHIPLHCFNGYSIFFVNYFSFTK